MANKELDELKGLSPGERVKKLKELEEKHKKDIEEVEAMIEESVTEIEQAEDRRVNLPIRQLAADTEDVLTGGEEKQMFKTKRFVSETAVQEVEETIAAAPAEQSLEEMAEEAKLKESTDEKQLGVSYDAGLGKTVKESAENIYGMTKELERQQEEYGALNQQSQHQIESMQEHIDHLQGYEADQQTKGLLKMEQGMLEQMAATQDSYKMSQNQNKPPY